MFSPRLTLTLSIVAAQAMTASAQDSRLYRAEMRDGADRLAENLSAASEATPLSSCTPYPIAIENDPAAEAAAIAALDRFAPGSTMAWSEARGTLSSVDNLAVDLACADEASLGDAVARIVERAPDLFQMDPTEWSIPSVPCGAITEQVHFLKFVRARMGAYAVNQDAITFIVKRVAGNLVLSSVYAHYLPKASANTTASLERCATQSRRTLERRLVTKRYQYTYYAPQPAPPCEELGTGSYFVRASDTLEIDPVSSVEWTEGERGVELRKIVNATILVAPSHQTPRLRNSNASCVMLIDGVMREQVGFRATLDAVTGAWIEMVAGPSAYCTTCLLGPTP